MYLLHITQTHTWRMRNIIVCVIFHAHAPGCDVDAAVVWGLSFPERIAGSTCILGTLASCQLRVVASVFACRQLNRDLNIVISKWSREDLVCFITCDCVFPFLLAQLAVVWMPVLVAGVCLFGNGLQSVSVFAHARKLSVESCCVR